MCSIENRLCFDPLCRGSISGDLRLTLCLRPKGQFSDQFSEYSIIPGGTDSDEGVALQIQSFFRCSKNSRVEMDSGMSNGRVYGQGYLKLNHAQCDSTFRKLNLT